MQRILYIVVIIIFSLLVTYIGTLWYQKFFRIHEKDKALIVFCDVGQGDMILIRWPQRPWEIIDSGPDEVHAAECVRKYIPPHERDDVRWWLSHFHQDHFGGGLALQRAFKIITIFTGGKISQEYASWITGFTDTHVQANLGACKGWEKNCTVLWPPVTLETPQDQNMQSLILFFTLGRFGVWLGGDAPQAQEKYALDSLPKELPEFVLIKLGHHGSKYSTSHELLKKLKPSVAVISSGKANRYGHPHEATLMRLKKNKIPYYRTDQDGDICIASDGIKVWLGCPPLWVWGWSPFAIF